MIKRKFVLNNKQVNVVECPVALSDCPTIQWCQENGHSEYREVIITDMPSGLTEQQVRFNMRASDEKKQAFIRQLVCHCTDCQYKKK